MTDLISRDALRESLGITGTAESCKGCSYDIGGWGLCCAKSAPSFDEVCVAIDDAPTVDAVPVRHGKWVTNKIGMFECSNCKTMLFSRSTLWRYCPFCGARMDAEREEE